MIMNDVISLLEYSKSHITIFSKGAIRKTTNLYEGRFSPGSYCTWDNIDGIYSFIGTTLEILHSYILDCLEPSDEVIPISNLHIA